MYQERERIRVRQPAGRYNQESKHTNMHTCVSVNVCVYLCVCECMCVLVRSENKSASHSSPPKLKCVRVISAYVSACSSTISLISLYCVCFVTQKHTHTHTHTQTLKTQENKCQAMMERQHFRKSTVSQYSATTNTHTHRSDESPAKTPGSRADNWLLDKPRDLYRGQTES